MRKKARKKLVTGVAVSAATLAAFFVRYGLKFGWKKFGHREPPTSHKRTHVSWKETILWTAVSGLISSFSKLLVRQTAKWAGEHS